MRWNNLKIFTQLRALCGPFLVFILVFNTKPIFSAEHHHDENEGSHGAEEDHHDEQNKHDHDDEENKHHNEDKHSHSKKIDHHDKHNGHDQDEENKHHNEDEEHLHKEKAGDEHHDAHGDEHDDHGGSSVGADKAITKIEDEGNHFWLSEEAEKSLSLSSTVFDKNKSNSFKLPHSAIVHFRYQAGIYIKENGGYKFVECKIVRKYKDNSLIQIKISKKKIEAIIAGTALLRVAHLQATGQGGKGHVH